MLPSNYSSMHVKDYSVYVHLGCSKEERTHKQEVRFNIDLSFPENPPGEVTDQLSDTVCYFEICEIIKKHVAEREFQLIETLSYNCLKLIKERYPQPNISVSCHKVTPPVENLKGGVEYVCRG